MQSKSEIGFVQIGESIFTADPNTDISIASNGEQDLKEEAEEISVIGIDRYEAQVADQRKPELTFQEKVERVEKAVLRSPLHREILYKILKYCRKQQILLDVEEHIATYPEFKNANQSQFVLMKYLIDAGGLDTFELKDDGTIVTEAEKLGLSEDEIDDLVATFAYQTSEPGLVVIETMSPQARLMGLLEIVPAYYDTYLEVLDFLQVKRSFAEVDTLLRDRDVLMANRDPDERPIQPSVFIDKLEKAGGIFYDNGWQTTEDGEELLESIRERLSD